MLRAARILVIDDDRVFREAVRAVLESAGYAVSEAADGDVGLRLHREQGADLVLVDIFLPGRDGLEVIRALRSEAPQAKIVAMSGGGRRGIIGVLDAAAAMGASRTLSKPFPPSELLRVVRDMLGEGGSDGLDRL